MHSSYSHSLVHRVNYKTIQMYDKSQSQNTAFKVYKSRVKIIKYKLSIDINYHCNHLKNMLVAIGIIYMCMLRIIASEVFHNDGSPMTSSPKRTLNLLLLLLLINKIILLVHFANFIVMT